MHKTGDIHGVLPARRRGGPVHGRAGGAEQEIEARAGAADHHGVLRISRKRRAGLRGVRAGPALLPPLPTAGNRAA
eukprot:9477716-Pyramimonas_sp.AAC.1